jgi:putative transposase
VAVGDGALGFCAAAREVWPETRAHTCWCKLANVPDRLPKRLQPRAKRALHEMMYAESRSECDAARTRFATEYQAQYPKAVESLAVNCERLKAFFDFPAEHWKHLRTINVIESALATVRLRERATKGDSHRSHSPAPMHRGCADIHCDDRCRENLPGRFDRQRTVREELAGK